MQRSCWRGIWSALALLALAFTSGIAAADVTGHWRVLEPGGDDFVDVVQAGSVVTLTYDVTGYAFDGSVSAAHVAATSDDATCNASLSLDLTPDESLLDGILVLSGGVCTFPTKTRTLLSRCECFDGNLANGDGCDSDCRIEPCFACSGEPSICTPAADGSACDDRQDCTTGETCTGGVCGGSSPVAPCIDLTGLWRRSANTFLGNFTERADIRQRGGTLIFRWEPEGTYSDVGTIDTSTGVMNLATPSTFFFCAGPLTFEGTAAADGRTYSGSGDFAIDRPTGCLSGTSTELGSRCGGGSVDPGEECDDGNASNGDGCDVDCAIEPCFECAGSPSTCTVLPDATACTDGDACTLAGSCSAGACIVTSSLVCAPCSVCDGAGACVNAPRDDCRVSTRPTTSRLRLTNRDPDTKDRLTSVWNRGVATGPLDLGHPDTTSAVALCLYEESAAVPALIFNGTIPPGGSCTTPPCWKRTANGSYLYKDRTGTAAGITAVALKVGAEGKSKVRVVGKGIGLAASPLGFPNPTVPLPLRAQVQISDGACFEATYAAPGIRKNTGGILRANGTP